MLRFFCRKKPWLRSSSRISLSSGQRWRARFVATQGESVRLPSPGMTNICGEKRARGWVASTLPVCAPMTARCVVYIDGGGGKRALERRKQPPRIIVTKHTLCSIFSSLTRLEGAWRGGKSERDPPSDLSTPSPPPSPSFRREFVRFFFL